MKMDRERARKLDSGEMTDSGRSVSMDIQTFSPGGKEYHINTFCGAVTVCVYGDQEKAALITYPDLALNHKSCVEGLLFSSEASLLLLHNFCIYYINPPGHEMGASEIRADVPIPSLDDLAEQIVEILDHFGLSAAMCFGFTAGAYILTLFAMKHRKRVLGLILVSPLCKPPSWTEWLYNKVLGNLLRYYGMCEMAKTFLLSRYSATNPQVPESHASRRLLDEFRSGNVWRFLEAINGRQDITGGLKKLDCRSLIFVGDRSPFNDEAIEMISFLDERLSALVEIQACGPEQPHAMTVPLEYFLAGYGMYRPPKGSVSLRSTLSLKIISDDLFSPESMGLKLKPIKTKVTPENW